MVVIKNGEIVSDPISYIALDEWLDLSINTGGVLLSPGQSLEPIAKYLEQIPVVAIEFPTFSDGRGFSTARQLRQEFGYKGEIRAVGHLIRDQYLFLHRCGFDSIEVNDENAIQEWQTAMNEISRSYQTALDDRLAISTLRQRQQAAE
ncbi:MAG: DUF934 domain-containing protein [Rhodospirillales bacterium]|mgnify:CR=1 FL=1|jgi:uncharacterized protein (DUF934 family)|nr:DUF934 domain-containing protein [Rhodospirillales bacterium]